MLFFPMFLVYGIILHTPYQAMLTKPMLTVSRLDPVLSLVRPYFSISATTC